MIELDGRSYVVDDPTTNAYNLLAYVNQFMTDHEVKDRKGNIVQFKISLASPIWLIIIGIGYMATVIQKIMYACAQAFNIGSCSDRQLLDLARIARLQRKEGGYTTIVTTVTASGGTCNITTDLTARATYEDNEYEFHPMNNYVIQAGTSKEVILICTVTGPVFIEAGAIDTFDVNPDNFMEMVSSASQPGRTQETVSELRTRLYTNEAVSPLQGAIQGLNALDGVNKAVIFYNNQYNTTMTVAGKTIPPKKAIVFVQGYSTKLAAEYFTHMSAETYADDDAVTAQYELQNGQSLPFNYFPPQSVELYLKLKFNKLLTVEREEQIKRAAALLSNSLNIGDNYTQAYILDSMNPNLNFPELMGCLISVDGVTWSETTDFNESNIGLITPDRIIMEVPDAE